MTLKEDVYNKIYNDVVTGVYKQNEIITEMSLISKYKVSKSPVREALIELCKEQILQSLPRLGYQVVPVSLKEVLDLIDFRIDVETSGLRRAYANIQESDLKELEVMAQICNEEAHDPNWDKNRTFHTRLYEISNNRYGYQELQSIMRKNERFLAQCFHTAWKNASIHTKDSHVEIVEALRRKDLERALKFLESDIRSVKEEILGKYAK